MPYQLHLQNKKNHSAKYPYSKRKSNIQWQKILIKIQFVTQKKSNNKTKLVGKIGSSSKASLPIDLREKPLQEENSERKGLGFPLSSCEDFFSAKGFWRKGIKSAIPGQKRKANKFQMKWNEHRQISFVGSTKINLNLSRWIEMRESWSNVTFNWVILTVGLEADDGISSC